jgi:hypothetical protein
MSIVHKYLVETKTIKPPPGFGDYLRGSIALYQLAHRLQIPLHLSFKGHPLEHCFIPIKSDLQESDNVLEIFVPPFDLSKENEKKITQNGPVTIFTNILFHEDVTEDCRQFICQFIEPNERIQKLLVEIMQKLQLKPKKYCVIHIRTGDKSFNNDGVNEARVQKICIIIDNLVKTIALSLESVLLLSDNQKLKLLLHQKYNLIINKIAPVHLGDCTHVKTPISQIDQTVVEFLLLRNSFQIYQISTFWWGSGFSDRVRDLYNVPIVRYKC